MQLTLLKRIIQWILVYSKRSVIISLFSYKTFSSLLKETLYPLIVTPHSSSLLPGPPCHRGCRTSGGRPSDDPLASVPRSSWGQCGGQVYPGGPASSSKNHNRVISGPAAVPGLWQIFPEWENLRSMAAMGATDLLVHATRSV